MSEKIDHFAFTYRGTTCIVEKMLGLWYPKIDVPDRRSERVKRSDMKTAKNAMRSAKRHIDQIISNAAKESGNATT